jgi:L-lactate dehydrogenase
MKVGIVGAGNVGIGIADALVLLDIAKELIIYNRTLDKALGEVYDLEDAVPFLNGSTIIRATDKLKELKGCKVVVITVGAKQKENQSRLDLLSTNVSIIKDIVTKLDEVDLTSNILMVTNPVEVLTRVALQTSKRDSRKVFGSGTVLDTMRLKEELGLRLGINRKNIHELVVGEHGDSEFALWSVANVGPIRLKDIPEFKGIQDDVMQKVRNRAYEIINKKGYTKQAIGVAVAKVIKAILYDEKKIFTLCAKLEKNCADICMDVAISQPCVVGKNGGEKKLLLDCSGDEIGLLKQSIDKLNDAYNTIK